MNNFFLPRIINNLNINNIDIKYNNNIDICISITLNHYLTLIKLQINNYLNIWDIYKKYTNPYEYIHTLIPEKKISVSKLKPLSRSFYKMIEICENYNFLHNQSQPITSFHLAEGPGGFIEALIYLHDNSNNIYYGMTLQSSNKDIPSWKKSSEFLKKHKNVFIENGPKKNGDLFEKENLEYCYKTYKNSIDIITGDGGFDFSMDFNNQEQNSIKLIFSQICYALAMQKKGGTFILKIFDIFTQSTLDLIYILCNYYNNVNIIKPYTSRIANSEKYLVCQDYNLQNYDIIEYFINNFDTIINNKLFIVRFLNISLPYIFINKLEECNAIFGQQQIENINNTITKIINDGKDINNKKSDSNKKSDNNEELIYSNINKCIIWCNKYNIPINQNILNR